MAEHDLLLLVMLAFLALAQLANVIFLDQRISRLENKHKGS